MRNGRVRGQIEGEDGGGGREGEAQAGYKAKNDVCMREKWANGESDGRSLAIRHTSCGRRFLGRITVPRCAIHVPPAHLSSAPCSLLPSEASGRQLFSYPIVQQPPTADLIIL